MAATPKSKFEAAVKVIQGLPKNGSFQPSNELMLKFYAYYKQATLGQCTAAKPSFWDVVGKAKWDAWSKLGAMPQEEAMLNYVEELKKIVEAMPHTTMVSDFVQTLGSFYELVDEKIANGVQSPSKGNGVINHTEPSSGSGSPGESSESSPSHALSSTFSGDDVGQLAIEASKEEDDTTPALTNGKSCEDHTRDEHGTEGVNGSQVVQSDSDAEEEFCDTVDLPQLAVTVGAVQGAPPDLTNGGSGLPTSATHSPALSSSVSASSSSPSPPLLSASRQCGGGDNTVYRQAGHTSDEATYSGNQWPQSGSPVMNPSQDTRQRTGLTGGGGGSQDPGPPGTSSPQVTEQITLALLRLQQDMNTVLARLSSLERHPPQHQQRNAWWWPFSGMNNSTVFLLIFWPVIVNLMFSLIRNRRER